MQSILILLLQYKYWILFPMAALEGSMVPLIVGFLVYSDIFNFFSAFIILILGDIISDIIYFYIGYFSDQSKFIRKYFLRSAVWTTSLSGIEKIWIQHPRKTMFFGKLAYGLAIPILISAGITKMPFKEFISYALPATIFQYFILMNIGYYLGNSYLLAVKYINYAYFLLAFFIIILVLVYILIIHYARRKIISMEERGGSL